jgi:hypothetical protein
MDFGNTYLRKGIAMAALLAASAASARDYYQYTGNGGTWETVNYINFYTSSPAGTDGYEAFPFDGGTTNLKYYNYEISIPSGTGCYQVETMPYSDLTNFDTRIWTHFHGYKSIDDDSGVGAGSKARIWLSGNSWLVLFVAAKNAFANTTRFEFKANKLNLGEAACTTGQSLPWVKSVNGIPTYSSNTN